MVPGLPNSRRDALAFYRIYLGRALERGPEALRAARRWLCRNDLFYLLTVPLNRKDMNRDWIFDRCREVQGSPNGHLDLWAREHYKAVDLDEPVPTPSGWVRHGDLRAGDWVCGPAGEPVQVVATTRVFTDADCWRVSFDDGYSVVVSGEHLWEVERRTRKRAARRAGQDRESLVLDTRAMARHDHATNSRLAVRLAKPLDMPEAMLPVAPYTLGAWLGDGHNAAGRVTCGDAEVFERIRADGYRLSAPPPSAPLTRTVYGIAPMLRDMGLMGDKGIPMPYQRASLAQRRALLQGLMDTDGHCNERGTATFVNKHERLARDVFALCAGFGLKPRFRCHVAEHGAVYHVSFQAYRCDEPFAIPRKLARCKSGMPVRRHFVVAVEPVEARPVSCIQVDSADGLYVIGCHHVVTHNSTVITWGLTIQDILASHGNEPEPRYNGREVTVGIFSHTRPIAKAFLKQIKIELENNPALKELFPDVLWVGEAPQATWSEDGGIIVRRSSNPKEATVEAWGLVDGQPTGRHFFIRVYDDVVTRESVYTPDQIKKTTEAWELSENLGTEGGWERTIGTRYHAHDTYHEMMRRGVVLPRIYPCTKDGTEDFDKPGNCVLMQPDTLKKKRQTQGPYTFGAQMLQNPTADKAQGFREEWVRYWTQTNWSTLNRYIIVDPSSGRRRAEKGADNDYTVFAVIGLGMDRNYYIIDLIRDRLQLGERARRLFELHKRYKPLKVGYEQYGMQADIEHIKAEQERANYRFSITELGGSMPKVDRIKRLVPVFEQGRMYLPRTCVHQGWDGTAYDGTQLFLQEEYLTFPVCRHDDMLDDVARILDPELAVEWPEEAKPSQNEWAAEAMAEIATANQDWMTG